MNSSRCSNYRIFKKSLILEDYLLELPYKFRIALCKFRTRNSRLPIELGIYNNVPRENRYCTKCQGNILGDEYHYLLECSHFSNDRKGYLKKIYLKHPSTLKLEELMHSRGSQLVNLCKFISIIVKNQ